MRLLLVCLATASLVGLAWLLWPIHDDAPLSVRPDRESTTYEYCIECGTDRETHTAWVNEVPTEPTTKVIVSNFYADLLDKTHEHVWVLNCTVWKSREGGEGIGCGFNGLPNSLVMQYEMNEEFRTFVQTRLESGAVRHGALVDASALRDLRTNEPGAAEARLLLDEYPGELR